MKFQYLTPILIASTLGAPIKVGSLLTGLLASSAAIGAVDSFVPVSPLKVCPTTMMAQCPLSKVKDSFTSVVKAATSTVESDKEKTKKVIGELKEINRGACPALNSFANGCLLPKDGTGIDKKTLNKAMRMYGADMFIAFALSTVVFGFDYNKKVSLSDISEISAGIEHECSLSRSVRGPAPVDLEHLSMALEFFKDGYMDLDAVVDWRMAIEENSPEKIADPNWKISTRTNIVGLAEFVIFWTKFEKNGLVSIADFNTFFMNEQWTEESCSKVIDTIPTFVRVLKLMWLKSSKEKKRDIERQMNKL